MQDTNTNTLSERGIFERFAGQDWAVNLSINGVPVNHFRPLPDRARAAWVQYWPLYGELHERGINQFIKAVNKAADASFHAPTVLDIPRLENCNPGVVELLTILLRTGSGMRWIDGSQVDFNTKALIINLGIAASDPDTTEIVELIMR